MSHKNTEIMIRLPNGKYENILTMDEVADFLRVDRATVLNLVKSGEIPCSKIGSELRFLVYDVWRYFLEQSNTEFVQYEPSPQLVRDPD